MGARTGRICLVSSAVRSRQGMPPAIRRLDHHIPAGVPNLPLTSDCMRSSSPSRGFVIDGETPWDPPSNRFRLHHDPLRRRSSHHVKPGVVRSPLAPTLWRPRGPSGLPWIEARDTVRDRAEVATAAKQYAVLLSGHMRAVDCTARVYLADRRLPRYHRRDFRVTSMQGAGIGRGCWRASGGTAALVRSRRGGESHER